MQASSMVDSGMGHWLCSHESEYKQAAWLTLARDTGSVAQPINLKVLGSMFEAFLRNQNENPFAVPCSRCCFYMY